MSMDLDTPVPVPALPASKTGAATFVAAILRPYPANRSRILCYNCGAPIDGTTSAGALCHDCIKLTIDISSGIPREATLHFCRDCDRWLQPPQHWLVAAPESRELLALCLRKLRGLTKVRIIDASFIWTEPHSRRIKVRLTVQQEAFESTILQQSFEVEYVVATQQCPECAKSYTHNTWRACVQVRQKVTHKRTFLFLEQLILKHGAHRDTINIKEAKDGLDFYFAARNHAEKFVDFLNSVAPVRTKKSQELISVDIHSATKSYKFSYSVELIPICKDDLVALPVKLAHSIGNIAPLALCHRIGTAINLLDPRTLHTADVATPQYWRAPFTSLAEVSELVEYVVMDIEMLGVTKGRWALAEATVARASDLGRNDVTYFTRTHLGNLLKVGDSVLGYHLAGTNFNNPAYEALEKSSSLASTLPDVVLVKKFYARKKKGTKGRTWRLKRMAKDEGELLPKKQDQDKMERDYEMFLRDVEEDAELRNVLQLYKNSNKGFREGRMEGVIQEGEKKVVDGGAAAMEVESEDGTEDDEVPKIEIDELLDEFEDLNVEEKEEDEV
ncbi:MAG: ribosome-binding protein [Vezdaea acicularis]|nr:MAG: ribosome-binding protein [Vezdaea acicularis]